jgi:multisubunit Na+/H+ antiporter MnhG subunit
VIAAVLIGAAVVVQALCCVGVARMPSALARLHYAAPGGVAAVLAAAGLLVHDGLDEISGRGVIIAALMLVAGPALAHASARAIHRRGRRA